MHIDTSTLALWPFRHGLKDRIEDYLAAIRASGFQRVEVAGFCHFSPAELSRRVDRHDLQVLSLHAPLLDPDKDVNEYEKWTTKFCDMFGAKNIVFSSIPSGKKAEADSHYSRIIGALITICQSLTPLKIRYHCYKHDFTENSRGVLHFQEMATALDRFSNFAFQFDTYWMQASGVEIGAIPVVLRGDLCHLTPEYDPKSGRFTISGVRDQVDALVDNTETVSRQFIIEPVFQRDFLPNQVRETLKQIKDLAWIT